MLDERIPLDHGLIGQETQGAGGFFMALRAIAVLKDVCAEMEELCPDAWIFNYTNPVNIVAEAITHHSPVKIVSLCEGPIYFATRSRSPRASTRSAPRDDGRLNHGCWGVEHDYDGRDPLPLLEEAWERRRDDPTLEPRRRRQLQLAVTMGSVPADYFEFYYFTDESWRSSVPSRRRRRRTSSAGRATTGATTRSRRRATTRSSTRLAHAAASTSSSSRST